MMKKSWLIAVLVLSNLAVMHAQSTIPGPKKLYRTWVTVQGNTKKVKGALYEVRDSAIVLSGSYEKTDYFKGKYNLTKLDVRDIQAISVRRNNAVGRGILFGGLSGIVLGGVVGLTATVPGGDDKEQGAAKGVSAIVLSIMTGTIGAMIGAALGPIRTQVSVNGSQLKFEKNMNKLSRRSLTYDPSMTGQRLTSFSRLRDTVVDVDGNVYHTVALGAMVYMAENLKVTHFRNGKEIAMVKDTAGWRKAESAAFCNFRNDSVNVDLYGRLYNGYVLTDTSAICPAGWHVPSFDEWTSLMMCLGGKENAGGYLKEAGTLHWSNPNKTMFTDNTFALPSGSRDRKGVFTRPGLTSNWWVAKEQEAEGFQGVMLTNETTAVTMIKPDKNAGLSVRCIRN
jgi:uncharacterized protein (TIGR02145 family)